MYDPRTNCLTGILILPPSKVGFSSVLMPILLVFTLWIFSWSPLFKPWLFSLDCWDKSFCSATTLKCFLFLPRFWNNRSWNTSMSSYQSWLCLYRGIFRQNFRKFSHEWYFQPFRKFSLRTNCAQGHRSLTFGNGPIPNNSIFNKAIVLLLPWIKFDLLCSLFHSKTLE